MSSRFATSRSHGAVGWKRSSHGLISGGIRATPCIGHLSGHLCWGWGEPREQAQRSDRKRNRRTEKDAVRVFLPRSPQAQDTGGWAAGRRRVLLGVPRSAWWSLVRSPGAFPTRGCREDSELLSGSWSLLSRTTTPVSQGDESAAPNSDCAARARTCSCPTLPGSCVEAPPSPH